MGVPNRDPELLQSAEQAGIDRVEDRPEFAQAVLDRRAGERQLLAGAEVADGSRRLGVRVLHHLRLVEHDGRPLDRAEVFEVARQQPVRGDHELSFGVAGEERLGCHPRIAADAADRLAAGAAVVDLHLELGREPLRLAAPVAHDAQGAHDEVRPGSFEEVGERGGGLAEAHVVGEATAEAELGEELHPRQAAALIVPEFAGEVGRFVRLLQHLVGEPVEQGADPVEVERLGFVAARVGRRRA